ncbi:transmembrane protein EpsG [Neobacillus niacini]|uniref:EpsG family protein n=1 Tax=Neobacillus driksii TaxID=3035913 RepID=UPI00278067C1|nr:EpsG family protein [Neobacillus niacini]MDQ0975364.1 transmembrane protein EpsG [Neobacillus niacini]
MTILWINLAIVFILSFFSRYFAVSTTGMLSSVPIKPNKALVFGTMVSLALVAGLRSNIGDTYFYKHSFEMNDFTWEFINSQKDIGFGLLQMVLKRYSNDPQILILTTAIITNILIVLVLYKYSRMFELSMFVYITGGLFLISMNGIRQCLAAAVIFTATKFLIEGSLLKYILVILVASTFHQSALVLIPIYFLVRYKAWSKATFILLFFSILIVLGFDKFSTILFSAIKDTEYGHYQNFNEGGASIIRVAVNLVPIAISYFGREKLRKIFPESDIIVNMSIIGFVFMIISTQNWIFARFSIYFTLYHLILISWIVKVFSEKDQRVIYYALLICYFIFYYYESVISLNIIYKSDYL